MKWFNKLRLSRKLTFSYIALLLVPLALLTAYAASASDAYVRDNARRSIEGMVEKARHSLSIKLSQYEQTLRFCMSNSMLQDVYKNQFNGYYALHVYLEEQLLPTYGGLVASSGGEIVSLVFYSETGLNRYDNYIRNISELGDEVFETGVNWRLSDDDLHADAPVFSQDAYSYSKRLGVIRMVLNLPALFDNYMAIGWDEYGMRVTDFEGRALFTKGDTQGADGRDYLVLSVALDNPGWRLEYYVPADTLTAPGSEILRAGFLLVTACVAALMLLSPLFTRSLLAGLEKLSANMRSVGATGELASIPRSGGEDEISRLNDQFADMLDRLNALMSERERANRQIGELELAVLRAQIDPHFLYNALSLINWKALRAGNAELSRVAIALSTFYRTCLSRGQDMITLRDELENVRSYIAIQLAMHRDSFSVIYDIDETLLPAMTLNFIFQPLVENAITHGVDQLREGGGEITISLKREGDTVLLSAQDNGPGMSDEQIASAPAAKTGGYGLGNIRKRLAIKFGAGYDLELTRRPERGVRAVLRVPYIENLMENPAYPPKN